MFHSTHNETNKIRYEEITPGYPILHIVNKHAEARIALHGAHLVHYAPHGGPPTIFTSEAAVYKEGKAIRGGIPVCWPWFGPHPDPRKNLPAHGYARTSFWELSHSETTTEHTYLLLTLPRSSDQTLGATLEFFIGKKLTLKLTTTNHGEKAETFSEALHSYFFVTNTHQTELLGLDGRDYIDTTTTPETSHRQDGPVHFPDEIDRIYASDDKLIICDPQSDRHIHINKNNSKSTIVWNPGKNKGSALSDLKNNEINQFICAEAGNVRDQSITIAPQSSHTLTLTISTSPANQPS
jgi:D-hexose-6-phosphate mutarotase